ncbi:MAG TPA: OmpA family protein, partial [Flavobacteriales bacterium]|nr:OmpA family protein [Flavobacteriales bacterium]
KKSNDGINKLKLYIADQKGKDWGGVKELPFNSDDYSTGHPALSPDDTKLYFVSDMPGGFGGTDVYVVEYNNGQWGTPVNLGKEINTEGNEMFPFITTDNVLFFASDGHKGLGGLDVMMANVTGTTFSKVRNPGAPINSTADDLGFVLRNSSSGYFSSDRLGGKGDDDIYSVTITAKLRNELKIDGIVREGTTNAPLAGVLVKKVGANGETLDSTMTDASGRYGFSLEPGQQYSITAEKEEFIKYATDLDLLTELDTLVEKDLTLVSALGISFLMHVTDLGTGDPLKDVNVNIVEDRSPEPLLIGMTNDKGNVRTALEKRAIGDELNMQIRLSRKGYLSKKITYNELIKAYGELKKNESMEVGLQPAAKGDDLGSLIDLQTIYFDVNKANIRPDAAAELNRMVEVMNDNPGIVIELGSHSDCRGSVEYNRVLSDKRAKSSMAFIVSKGIARSRITGK